MSHRISRRALLGAAAAAPVASLLGCSDDEPALSNDGPPDKVTYVTALAHFGREAYAHLAVQSGIFAELNLDVTIEPGSGGPPNHAALVSGAAQFASVDSSGALQRHANGGDEFQIISAVQQLPLSAIVTLEGNGINQPQDLEGKVIGGLAGSVIEDMFPAYAQLAGFDHTTVEFVHFEAPALPQMLASGQVDAIGLFLVGAPSVAAVAGRPTVTLAYGEVLTDVYGAVHVTTRELVESNPDLVRRFNTGLLRGLKAAIADPAAAARALKEMVPATDEAAAAAEIELMAPYVTAELSPNDPIGTLVGSRVARAVGVLQSIDYVPSGDLAVLQEAVAWDLVPGGEGNRDR